MSGPQHRFGLEDGRSRTLEEVGREFNVTRERIRQIEAKTLRTIRPLPLHEAEGRRGLAALRAQAPLAR